ncbi:hypothetical protein SKAU_G00325910 [Synaphobranchus kaupii]|uniref:C2H2-type domain-containing protein n=1 Tax=Synaphobranchus kaupii TaxID=118154 RepID=A0A9Q1EPT5_SYNKA|nr:hypothetical protein SKAU_G00325910 [Synaphobranchus kaupii]
MPGQGYFILLITKRIVVACFCVASTEKRSHFHCRLCSFRAFSHPDNFIIHLRKAHRLCGMKTKEAQESEKTHVGDPWQK